MFEKKNIYPANAFRVCINSGETDIVGVAFSPMEKEPIYYEGFNDLLLKMDLVFDKNGYPQAFQEKRSFIRRKNGAAPYKGIPKISEESAEIFKKTGDLATADVVVNTRRSTSWQGSVYKIDSTKVGSFKGEIELLQMLLQYREDDKKTG